MVRAQYSGTVKRSVGVCYTQTGLTEDLSLGHYYQIRCVDNEECEGYIKGIVEALKHALKGVEDKINAHHNGFDSSLKLSSVIYMTHGDYLANGG